LPGAGVSAIVKGRGPVADRGATVEDKMALIHSDLIEVKRVKGKGRGVFARRPIREGELIERVPVLVLPLDEIKNGDEWTGLAGYCFLWGEGTVALALGYGSLYNHSFDPNARYDDESPRAKSYSAIRDIAAGEEITINYNGEPTDRSPVGFDVIEVAAPPAAEGSKAKR
jgi:SET domain-containing protein